MKDRDRVLSDNLVADGLALGPWITIADPGEVEWPFEKRHPGQSFPSDPTLVAMEERRRNTEIEAERKGISLKGTAY